MILHFAFYLGVSDILVYLPSSSLIPGEVIGEPPGELQFFGGGWGWVVSEVSAGELLHPWASLISNSSLGHITVCNLHCNLFSWSILALESSLFCTHWLLYLLGVKWQLSRFRSELKHCPCLSCLSFRLLCIIICM